MAKGRSAGWIGGTVVLVLAIWGASWMWLISPRFDAAAATMEQVQDTRDRNDILRAQVAKLADQHARLDEFKAELATIHAQIPPQAQLAALTDAVHLAATETGVTVVEISPGASAVITLPTAPAPAPAPTPTEDDGTEGEGTEGEGAADGTDTPPPAPAAPVLEGFVQVPYNVKVVGPYANVALFVDRMQSLQRLVLVGAVDVVRQKAAEPTQGRPALADGDVEAAVTALTFVLVPQPAAVPTDPPTDEEQPEPAPVESDRNPFVPLAPSA